MQGPVVTLSALLLVAALCSPTSSAPVGTDIPTICCFSYTSRPLPIRLLSYYEETSSRCSKPAIIFTTKKGREVCADPSEEWVQDRIQDLKHS
ncbi:C-C motif chemokine 4 [Ornithorhynchus anatinus]|nr:C-C motif chemokine 4 [Ornithorhynchus anatinus]